MSAAWGEKERVPTRKKMAFSRALLRYAAKLRLALAEESLESGDHRALVAVVVGVRLALVHHREQPLGRVQHGVRAEGRPPVSFGIFLCAFFQASRVRFGFFPRPSRVKGSHFWKSRRSRARVRVSSRDRPQSLETRLTQSLSKFHKVGLARIEINAVVSRLGRHGRHDHHLRDRPLHRAQVPPADS